MFFLHDLKEESILITKWLKGDPNRVDIFTKYSARPTYNKCVELFVSKDKYIK